MHLGAPDLVAALNFGVFSLPPSGHTHERLATIGGLFLGGAIIKGRPSLDSARDLKLARSRIFVCVKEQNESAKWNFPALSSDA